MSLRWKWSSRILIIFLLIFSAVYYGQAQESNKTKVAVMPPTASGKAEASTAQALTSLIVTELSLSPSLQVTDRRDVEKVLKEQALSQSGFCEQSCQIEIGKILQSKWVVTGDLNKLGKLYILTLKVLNVETGEVEVQDEEKHTGEEEGLVEAAKNVSARIRRFLEGGKPEKPEKPEKPSEPEKKTYGTLKVTTTPPGATVILDAENAGRTPLTLKNVPAGKHTLILSLSGHVDIEKGITVEKDKTLELTEELVLQTGTISVSSTPSDASVYLDNSFQGKTPLELKNVPVGTHTVRVGLEHYAPDEKTLDVKYKDTVALNFSLSGLPGKIAVTSTPQGAKVWVDGKDAGETPVYGYGLPAGSHTVKVSLSGYKTQTETLDILPNQPKTLNFSLEVIKTATLTINSTPSSARVLVNNEEKGKTPLTLSDLPPGTYKIIIKKEGYKEFWGEVTLSEGEEKEAPVTLTKTVAQGFSPDDMVLIPAGEFYMGSTEEEAQDGWALCKKYYQDCPWDLFKAEMPKHKVYLDAYSIDKYEVTNAQYKACVSAGKCKQPSDLKWYNDSSKANHPVVYVDWYQASAYCKWAGKRLPTEAEWEKAARGEQGNIWPWGNEWDCKKSCNSVSPCNQSSTCAVGSYSSDVSPYGVYDMGGNVWEWVSDWWQYYKNSPVQNPKGPTSGTYKVLRGGSWVSLESYFRGALRVRLVPADWDGGSGFRCAGAGD